MPWFHEMLTKLVEVHIDERYHNVVLNSLFTSITLASELGAPTPYKPRLFTINTLTDAIYVNPEQLEKNHNMHLLRQFDMFLKRLVFEHLPIEDNPDSKQTILDAAFNQFCKLRDNLDINQHYLKGKYKESEIEQIKKGLTSIIDANIDYFDNEPNFLSFDAKISILSQFYLYLAQRKDQVMPKDAMTEFFALCSLYVKLEESPDGNIWLSDFINPFLELASPLFYNLSQTSIIKTLKSIERNLLQELQFNIGVNTKPLGIFAANHVDPQIIDEMVKEVTSSQFNSHPDEQIIKSMINQLNLIITETYANEDKAQPLIKVVSKSIQDADFSKKAIAAVLDYTKAVLLSFAKDKSTLLGINEQFDMLYRSLNHLSKNEFIDKLRMSFSKRQYPSLSLFSLDSENQKPPILAETKKVEQEVRTSQIWRAL